MKSWPMGYLIPNYTKVCGCNFDGCEMTYDRNKFASSDIVWFHGPDIPNLKLLSLKRPVNQLWVYYTIENSYHTPSIEGINNYFNLTSTYRLNSNLRDAYRDHISIPPSDVKKIQPVNYAKGKSRQIAWAVTNCGQQRDQLAEKLHNFGLQIDNFGKCRIPYVNRRPYSRSVKSPYHEYKFVFAAENRLCQDYVTEKYWRRSFNTGVNAIPIVLGGANYSDPRIAIPGSFIDALKFSSPKALAEYLLLVDKNDTLFNEYFKWKPYWTFYDIGRPSRCRLVLCEMCNKLHTNSWKFKNKPLTSTMNKSKECKPTEDYFRTWINRV